jgi:inhibitor of cysteine peptidase
MRRINLLMFMFIFFMSSIFASETIPTYTQDKTGFSVSVQNKEFIIKLKSNPTTGYTWFLTDYNAGLLEPVKQVFEAAANKKMIGASGYELWTFRMKPSAFVVPQQTLIRFVYSRPWEQSEPGQVETFRVTTISAP